MFCPAGPFEMVCCLYLASPHGMVQRSFWLAHTSWDNAMSGWSIWGGLLPVSSQSISTGMPSQLAGPYGMLLSSIWLAHMGWYNVLSSWFIWDGMLPLSGQCHTVKVFHSQNIGFGTIFLHYHYFLWTHKNHDSRLFNILGIQDEYQIRR